jgi:3-mercaptopyruvate sulfurtransferase SseA
MGLKPVSHLKGGYGAWRAAGAPTEPLPPKKAAG